MGTKTKKIDAGKYLSKKLGPMTFGMFLRAMRESEEITLAEFAARLKLSRANLCDLEKGRKIPSPMRAATIAEAIGVPPKVLVQLAVQDSFREANLKFEIEIREAS